MKTVIATTSPVFGTVPRVQERITANGWEFIRCVDGSREDGGMSDHLERMDVLVVGLVPATADCITRAPRLKAILKHGVGVDNIDIPAATRRKIPVLNAPGANANAVAELAVGGMLSLARRIPMAHQVLVSGGWQRTVGTEIADKVLGIVGLGNIGRALSLKARALGMRVLACDPFADKAFAATNQVKIVSLDELLQQSDYVSLHIFGGKDNTHLIGSRELALMKPDACLMNYARGEVVDLNALAEALDRDGLRGAAIDAYITEPPDRSHPIFASPKVVFTPHCGADTKESAERVGMMTVMDIENVLAGKRSERVLNPEIY